MLLHVQDGTTQKRGTRQDRVKSRCERQEERSKCKTLCLSRGQGREKKTEMEERARVITKLISPYRKKTSGFSGSPLKATSRANAFARRQPSPLPQLFPTPSSCFHHQILTRRQRLKIWSPSAQECSLIRDAGDTLTENTIRSSQHRPRPKDMTARESRWSPGLVGVERCPQRKEEVGEQGSGKRRG